MRFNISLHNLLWSTASFHCDANAGFIVVTCCQSEEQRPLPIVAVKGPLIEARVSFSWSRGLAINILKIVGHVLLLPY